VLKRLALRYSHCILRRPELPARRKLTLRRSLPSQMCAIQARKYNTTLRRARLDITIEIRWCPAHRVTRGTRRPMNWPSLRQRMESVFGPVRRAAGVPACIRHTPQVRDFREEVGGISELGSRPDYQQEVQAAGQAERWLVAGRGSPLGSTS
jgi:hypothetical protein